jgi:hypothetical protein
MALYHYTVFPSYEKTIYEACVDRLPEPWIDEEGNEQRAGVGVNTCGIGIITIKPCNPSCSVGSELQPVNG